MDRVFTSRGSILPVKHGWRILLSQQPQIWRRHTSTAARKVGQRGGIKGSEHQLVISGISGRFPRSRNFEEFKSNLINGVDMVQEEQGRFHSEVLPKRVGSMYDLDRFDASFFGIVPKLADNMDPEQRLLMEVTFEAIIDAGLNPEKLRGSKIGVFVGSAGGESSIHPLLYGTESNADGYVVIGQSNFMLPNRISFGFDFRGASLPISTGCSASLIAMEVAAAAIRDGNCDAAIVAGTNAYLNGKFTHELIAIGALAMDGKCKSFDAEANGFARAEAVVAVLIQKEKDAKRSYARIRNVRSNADGYKPEGVSYPSGKSQAELLSEIYRDINPNQVTYVETHGTGTPVGDPQEIGALAQVFCNSGRREEPLMIGSVKSNMGHGESAAGLCGLAKLVSVFQTGVIPSNLHFKNPNPECAPLLDGSVKVVVEPTPFPGGLVGLNSFGLGGTNAHAVIEPFTQNQRSDTNVGIPILLPLSGRTKEGVEASIRNAFEDGHNPAFRAMLQGAFQGVIPGHSFRGYGILQPGGKTGSVHVDTFDGLRSRPIWFVFPGMGCQWHEMHKEMMKIEPFAHSFQESKKTLTNLGIDVEETLSANNPAIFNNIRLAFVSIAAVQIGLLECLKTIGIAPDGFFGHSAGELICAYADGCLTAEETLRMMEARGRAFLQGQPMPGGMISVGLPWSEVEGRCPPGIYPACNNGPNNVSVSGPEEAIKEFAQSLQKEGIFAREVNTCGTSPHCVYMDAVTALMGQYFGEILKGVKRPRSEKWISTSLPKDKWTSEGQFSGADYHARNARNPVLFREACQEVPSNAIVIEVGPRGLFQALLKESIPSDGYYAKLMEPKAEDSTLYFLDSLGKLYTRGLGMDIASLYPPVPFPVSSTTPSIGHLVTWDHSASWKTPFIGYPRRSGYLTRIDLQDPKFSFLRGHRVGNRTIFPTTGYLWLAWRTFADASGIPLDNFPVKLEDIHLERATFLSEKRPTDFSFSMLDGRGNFEIRENDEVVVRGKMTRIESSGNTVREQEIRKSPRGTSEQLSLSTQDAYKELGLRGYRYGGEFRGILAVDNEGKWADVVWKGNWVTFLDTVLQTMLFSAVTRSTLVPVRFREISINPIELLEYVKNVERTKAAEECSSREDEPSTESSESHGKIKAKDDENDTIRIPVSIRQNLQTIRCPGVEVKEIVPSVVQLKAQAEKLAFQKHEFSPFMEPLPTKSFREGIWEAIDLVLENNASINFEAVDIFTRQEHSVSQIVSEVFKYVPKFKTQLTLMTLASEADKIKEGDKGMTVVVTQNELSDLIPGALSDLVFLNDISLLDRVVANLTKGFVLVHGETQLQNPPPGTRLVSKKQFSDGSLVLLRKLLPSDVPPTIHHIQISEDLEWLPKLQEVMAKSTSGSDNERVILTAHNVPDSGILGLVKCLRLEPGGDRIRCVFKVDDGDARAGDTSELFSFPQSIIENDLVFNVYKNGSWGSYRHLPVHEETTVRPVEHAQLAQLTPGDLSSFRWVESPLKYYQRTNSTMRRYEVVYAAFNFRDVMIAAGKLPVDPYTAASGRLFGWEFSGYDEDGNRVTGIPLTSSFATSVLADTRCVTPVPDSWTLEQAATIPMAYQAALNMVHRGRLQRGQSVLIHSGAGGVGQAAINIALAHQCEIFTTVGTEEKRKRLKELFPQLKDENIGNSRDSSFETQIMELTNGRGVDMVLNSLAGDKLQASVRCLARNGKFLEIGAFDAFQNEPLGLGAFLKNIDFHGIFQAWDFRAGSVAEMLVPQHELSGSDGWIRPLSTTCFKINEIESAFRYFASGKSVGKILCQIRDEDKSVVKPLEAYAKTYFRPDRVYLVIGGLGGLGLEMTNWMIERGARHVILTSRSGVSTGYQSLCIRKWREAGVTVETPKVDLSDYDTAEALIIQPGLADKIGGIFNSGLVLKDMLMENMTKEDFESVFPAKIKVTKNLDVLTRRHCKNLDYFVVSSSVTCGRGNAGQTNYGYANSVMERICENRVKDGLHGLAVQWGIIGEVGYVAEKLLQGRDPLVTSGLTEAGEGIKPQSIASCLQVLDQAIQLPHPICLSMVVADRERESSSSLSLAERVKTIFGIELDKINPTIKLTDLGMDSMILFELKQTLERDYDLPMTSNQLRHLTIGDIKAIDGGTFTVANLGGKSAGPTPSSDLDDIILFEVPLVQLKKVEDSRDRPLFIIHGIPGNASAFAHLAEQLDVSTFGLQFGRHSNPDTLGQVAEAYLKEIRNVQPHGPYNIAAHSSGGPIAYEITAKLDSMYGEKVENLILLDGSCSWEGYETDQKQFYVNFLKLLRVFSDEQVESLSNMFGADVTENIKDLAEVLKQTYGIGNTEGLTDTIQLYLKLMYAVEQYRPRYTFTGNTTLIKAKSKSPIMAAFTEENFGVEKYCRGFLSVVSVEGDHRSFLHKDNVHETAEIINKLLTRDNLENNLEKQKASN